MAKRKRPYHKPTVERISLAGEETAASPNCKTVGAGGGFEAHPPDACRVKFLIRCKNSLGS